MLEGCVKYVVGGFRNGAYTKSGFISSAKSSVDPDPFYPLQSYNWSDKSTTFPERLLLKNTLATSDESEGLDVSTNRTKKSRNTRSPSTPSTKTVTARHTSPTCSKFPHLHSTRRRP